MNIRVTMPRSFAYSLLICVVVLSGVSSQVIAQPELPEGVPLMSLELSGEYLPEVSVIDTDASSSLMRAALNASFATLNFGYIRDDYQWDAPKSLPFGNGADDPWKMLQTLAFDGVYGGGLNEKWAYFMYANGSMAFEDEIGSAYRVATIGGGAQYAWYQNLQLFLGAGAMYDDMEEAVFDGFEHLMPYPVGGFRWNQYPNSGLAVSVILPQEAKLSYRAEDQTIAASIATNWSLGLTANLSYQLSQLIGIELNGEIGAGDTYRLADDSKVLAQRTGTKYFSSEYNVIEAAMTYQATPQFSLKAGPYYTFGRTLEIVDNCNERLADVDADDAIGGKFSIAFEF